MHSQDWLCYQNLRRVQPLPHALPAPPHTVRASVAQAILAGRFSLLPGGEEKMRRQSGRRQGLQLRRHAGFP